MQEERQTVDIFNTQIRPATSAPTKRHSQNALQHLKQVKYKAKIFDEHYKNMCASVTKTQNSISKINRHTQKVRVNFLKLYENKKMKITNNQLVQNKELQDKNYHLSVMKRTKQRKLMEQLQLHATRNEEEQRNLSKQQKNKEQKELMKKVLRAKSFDQQMLAKTSYNKIKNEKSYIDFRNKKFDQIMVMKGKLNYAQQVEKEVQMIKEYQNILNRLEGLTTDRPSTTTTYSKNFFVTSQRVDSKPPTRGHDTSHTSRTHR